MEELNKIKISNWRYIVATIIPFLLLLGTFSYTLINLQNRISDTEKELEGMHDIELIQKAVMIVQQIRGLTNIRLYGDENVEEKIESLKKEYDATHEEIVNDEHVTLFAMKDVFEGMRGKLSSIISKSKGDVSPFDIFYEFSDLVSKMMASKWMVANRSYLLVDPEQDSYHLLELSLKHIPGIIESIGQLRGISSAILVRGIQNEDERAILLKHVTILQSQYQSLEREETIFKDASVGSWEELNRLDEEFESSFHLYLDQINRIIDSATTTSTPISLFKKGTDLISKADSLNKKVSILLTLHLQDRTKKLNRWFNLIFSGIVLSFIFILYFIIGFYRANRNAFLKLQEYRNLEYENHERSIRFKEALLSLSKETFQSIETNFNTITELTGNALDVSRTSIWLYDSDKAAILCQDIFIKDKNVHESGLRLASKDYPKYFNGISNNEPIIAEDAQKNEFTEEFTDSYLRPLQIFSMLDVPIWHKGEVIGIICCEQTGEVRRWLSEEEDFLINISKVVSETMLSSERFMIEREVQKLSQAVIQSPASVVITDPDGNIEFVNPTFTYVTGYSEEEAIGQNPRILKSGRHNDAFYEDMWKAISSGKTWKGEICNKNKEGGLYWESVSISPIVNAKGEVVNFVAVKQDVTELNRAKEEAEQATRAKSDFLANMSHELRTPLNAILGFSEMLATEMAGELNDIQKEYLNDVYESGNHLLLLINDILDLSKVESGNMELDLSKVEINSLIARCLVFFKEKALNKNLTITTDIKGDGDEILADELKLKQVLINLIGNAVKFTNDNGRITVYAQKSDKGIKITIEDSGIGIDKKDMNRLFEPFQQLENVYTKKVQGTGLGLALSKRMIEMHGGTLTVKSVLGKGSSFTITIPAIKEIKH
ncbi:MAG: ATP-binding protein [bacterium]|nr:ATP-binding protein [bacterium]